MTPSFFLTICLGGIICLTPMAIYLLWLGALNRKTQPTIVSASWEFVGLLAGLTGFLFCTGVMLGSAVADSGLFTHGPFARLAAWLPKWNLAYLLTLVAYVLFVTRAVRKGIGARKHSLAAFNVDWDTLVATVDEVLLLAGRTANRAGNAWQENGGPVVEVVPFAVFRHATINLVTPDVALRETLENGLRQAVPRLPAANENPAAPWISGAATCSLVFVGCCVALIFAMPFLR